MYRSRSSVRAADLSLLQSVGTSLHRGPQSSVSPLGRPGYVPMLNHGRALLPTQHPLRQIGSPLRFRRFNSQNHSLPCRSMCGPFPALHSTTPAATFGMPPPRCQFENGPVERRPSPTQRANSKAGFSATAALTTLTLAAPLSTTADQAPPLHDGVPPVECTHAAPSTVPVNASPICSAAGVAPTVARPAPRRPTDLQLIRSSATQSSRTLWCPRYYR